jgi:putative sterol carrier protein
MSTISKIFESMSARYQPGRAKAPRTYYFSIGDDKYTVKCTPTDCQVESGKTVDNADVVLKATPDVFEKMVLKGKLPGALDIARGKIKTNDPGALKDLRDWFDFSGM